MFPNFIRWINLSMINVSNTAPLAVFWIEYSLHATFADIEYTIFIRYSSPKLTERHGDLEAVLLFPA